MLSQIALAEIIYNKNPAHFYDRVDGECRMPWLQAIEDEPEEVIEAFTDAEDILRSSDASRRILNILSTDQFLDTLAKFTWSHGVEWFVETPYGDFLWKDPSYGGDNPGDNTITLWTGGYKSFDKKYAKGYGRDKGYHTLRRYCGEAVKLVIPE